MTVLKIKTSKSAKRCVIKRKIKFEDYQNFLDRNQLMNILFEYSSWYVFYQLEKKKKFT